MMIKLGFCPLTIKKELPAQSVEIVRFEFSRRAGQSRNRTGSAENVENPFGGRPPDSGPPEKRSPAPAAKAGNGANKTARQNGCTASSILNAQSQPQPVRSAHHCLTVADGRVTLGYLAEIGRGRWCAWWTNDDYLGTFDGRVAAINAVSAREQLLAR